MSNNHTLVFPTLTGTLLSVSYIDQNDIVKAALLAAVGATVSVAVSLLLRCLLKIIKQKFRI